MGYYAAAAAVIGGVIQGQGEQDAAEAQIEQRNRAIRQANRAREALTNSVVDGNFLGQFGLEETFGTVPEAALFEPVDIREAQLSQIDTNVNEATPRLLDFTETVNSSILENDQRRINELVPSFSENFDNLQGATRDLLLGRLPFEDALDVVADRSEFANSIGLTGASTEATLRDLGLSRLDAFNQGRQAFDQTVTTAERVSPVSAQLRPQQVLNSFFISPQDRVAFDIQQAQLVQQSQQNAFNLAAAAEPAANALFNSELQAQLVNAGLQSSGGVGAGLGLQGLGSGITSAAEIIAANNARQNNNSGQNVNSSGGFNPTV